MATNIELRLEISPVAEQEFTAAGLLSGTPATRMLRRVHFDTPDGTLAAAGRSLCICTTNAAAIQTVTLQDGACAGLFATDERESPVDDAEPVLEGCPDVQDLPPPGERLIPAFVLEAERRIWTVAQATADIVLTIDTGRITAGLRHATFCELRLAQARDGMDKPGDPGRLFNLARRIDAVAPARIVVQSATERARDLVGPLPASVKAENPALGEAADTAAAFDAIARTCLRQFRLNESLLLAQACPAPEALHQARVALRRLRSALTIFGPILTGPAADGFRDDFRWLAGTLGEAREIDVLIARAGAEVPAALFAERIRAHDAAKGALDSARARRLVLDFTAWLSDGDWLRDPATRETRELRARDFAAAALSRRRRKMKLRQRPLAELDPEARHELRKAAKKLRYGVEFFATLFEGKAARRRREAFVPALERLQDRLGALNDLATAPALVARLAPSQEEARRLLAPGDEAGLLAEAGEAYEELMEARRFWE